jgi:small-conductance mechanosensitive channel
MDLQLVIDALLRIVRDIVSYIPHAANGLLVLLLGYLIARFVRWLLRGVLRRLGFDQLTEQTGVVTGLRRLGIRLSPSALIAQIAFAFLLLTFMITAARLLQLEPVAALLEQLIAFLPNLVAALIVFLLGSNIARIAGLFVAGAAAGAGLTYARPLGRLVEYLLGLFVVILALGVLGIDVGLLVTAIILVIAAFGLALGLGLGLGARTIIYQILAGYYVRKRFRLGQTIRIGDVRGELSGVGSVSSVVDTGDGALVMPNATLIEHGVRTPPAARSAADTTEGQPTS